MEVRTIAGTESKIMTRPVVEQTRVDGCLSYLLLDPETLQAAVIDPRFDSVDPLLLRLKDGGLKLVAAIDTHAHADHVSGVARIAAETGAQAIVSSAVAFPARVVKDGDEVKVGGYVLKVATTPGHTEESISLKVGDVVFTGDALLIGGAGRTDFQNGSPETLFETFEAKLRKLPSSTVVYPGHDYRGRTHTTIGDELRANRLFAEKERAAFIARLTASHQPEPANMRFVLAANRAGVQGGTALLDAHGLKARLDAGERMHLIDVRSPAEFAGSRMAGARNIPLERVAAEAALLDRALPVVLMCEAGVRSTMALPAFAGRPNVATLTGGMSAWRKAGFPTEGSAGGVWPLERQVRLVAGAFVFLGAVLGLTVNPWFFSIPLFFGAGLAFSGLTGTCGMGLMLAKLPWNQRAVSASANAGAGAGGSCAVGGGGGSCSAEPSGGGCAAS
jgi:glyoxylase-like metal-dependent hydrolase (beta-lactamase superfamily II)